MYREVCCDFRRPRVRIAVNRLDSGGMERKKKPNINQNLPTSHVLAVDDVGRGCGGKTPSTPRGVTRSFVFCGLHKTGKRYDT